MATTRTPNTVCAQCGAPIYRRPSALLNGSVFCSRACHGASQRKTKTCPVCEVEYVGAKKTCSRSCANRQRRGMRYTRANARNKATKGAYLKERLGAARGGRCERCGYDNYNILQVHHILPRSEGGTNALRNLQLLCPNCHMEVHYGYGTYGGSSR